MSTPLTKSLVWTELQKIANKWRNEKIHMKDLFEKDPDRFKKFSVLFNGPESDHILFDFSKNLIDDQVLQKLFDLVVQENVKGQVDSAMRGARINFTEDRAVLHTALRTRDENGIVRAEGSDSNILEDVRHELSRMESIAEKIRRGDWKGFTGKTIKSVVNIGIGGSDLGPVMVVEALKPYKHKDLSFHFVSNIDGTHISEVLKMCDPETTLFLVASKTFTTQETISNAKTARLWLTNGLNMIVGQEKKAVKLHFIALSTNAKKVDEFGIDAENNMLVFWNWVGGRYSLWSAIGLSIMISIGPKRFYEFLDGAHAMDIHMQNESVEQNLPYIMALLGIWYNNFWNCETATILAYDQYMSRFAAYFQQGDMESNGKRIRKDGLLVDYSTGPIIWGEPGTNGQHAFYQLIHQGTKLVPCDFIAPITTQNEVKVPQDHHQILLSNFFAQTEALMKGKTEDEAAAELDGLGKSKEKKDILARHMTFPGNRPTNSILVQKVTPWTLGALIALYEHKIFIQGLIWNINSFDQMGVELGKQLAKRILPEIESGERVTGHDCSTNGLLNHYLSHKEQ